MLEMTRPGGGSGGVPRAEVLGQDVELARRDTPLDLRHVPVRRRVVQVAPCYGRRARLRHNATRAVVFEYRGTQCTWVSTQ